MFETQSKKYKWQPVSVAIKALYEMIKPLIDYHLEYI